MPYRYTGNSHATVSPDRDENSAFTPAKAGTQFSDPGGMQGWFDLRYVKADQLGIKPATCQSQVQRPTSAAPRNMLDVKAWSTHTSNNVEATLTSTTKSNVASTLLLVRTGLKT